MYWLLAKPSVSQLPPERAMVLPPAVKVSEGVPDSEGPLPVIWTLLLVSSFTVSDELSVMVVALTLAMVKVALLRLLPVTLIRWFARKPSVSQLPADRSMVLSVRSNESCGLPAIWAPVSLNVSTVDEMVDIVADGGAAGSAANSAWMTSPRFSTFLRLVSRSPGPIGLPPAAPSLTPRVMSKSTEPPRRIF